MAEFRRTTHGAISSSSTRWEEHIHTFLAKLDDQPLEKLQQLFTMVYTEYLRNLKQLQVLNAQLQGTRSQFNEVSRRAMLAAQVLQPVAQQREIPIPPTPSTLPADVLFTSAASVVDASSQELPRSPIDPSRRDMAQGPSEVPEFQQDEGMQQLQQLLMMNASSKLSAKAPPLVQVSLPPGSVPGTSPMTGSGVHDHGQEPDDLIQQLQNALGIRGGANTTSSQQSGGTNPSVDIQMLLQSVLPSRSKEGGAQSGGFDFSAPLLARGALCATARGGRG